MRKDEFRFLSQTTRAAHKMWKGNFVSNSAKIAFKNVVVVVFFVFCRSSFSTLILLVGSFDL